MLAALSFVLGQHNEGMLRRPHPRLTVDLDRSTRLTGNDHDAVQPDVEHADTVRQPTHVKWHAALEAVAPLDLDAQARLAARPDVHLADSRRRHQVPRIDHLGRSTHDLLDNLLPIDHCPRNQFQWLGRSGEADPLLIERNDSAAINLAILTAAGGNARFEDADGQGLDTYDGAFATPDQIVVAGHYDNGTFGFSAIDVYEIGLYTRALAAGEKAFLADYLRNKHGF